MPEKEGYTFAGWFYDEEFTNKVDGETTLSITPIEDIDENGCVIGYKDIKIYAKWVEE